MKIKIIGLFCLFVSLIAFWDAVAPGGITVTGFHIRPFILPVFALVIGWLELHGRESKYHENGHAHGIAIVFALMLLVILLAALSNKL